MRAVARAQPNIALVKYWGKRDAVRNLPAVGSISITLADWYTEMAVETFVGRDDRLEVNGKAAPSMLSRVSRCLDDLLGGQRPRFRIDSRANFPVAAGLASSASAFAALVVAAAAAGGLAADTLALARAAGRASGSAARSLYGGFVELDDRGEEISLATLADAGDWPLRVVAAVTDGGRKPVGSGEAMERSRASSPFYARWLETQGADLAAARGAILGRDFAALRAVAEHNCLKMHALTWTSRPPVVYWNAATVECLSALRALAADGVEVLFTMDAGPQVKAVCTPSAEPEVVRVLRDTPGVTEVLTSGIGRGARLEEGP